MNNIENSNIISLFNKNTIAQEHSLQMVEKSGRLYLVNPRYVTVDKIEGLLKAFNLEIKQTAGTETELPVMRKGNESAIEGGMKKALLKMMGGGDPENASTEQLTPLIQRFAANPSQFYKEIQARRVEATFHGYDRNSFTYPEISEAFEEMHRHIEEKAAQLAQSPFPLLRAFGGYLSGMEDEIKSLEVGVKISSDQGKVRTVKYPYEASVNLCLHYLFLLDQILRIEKRMIQVLPESERVPFYRECEQEVLNSLDTGSFDRSDPKMIEALFHNIDSKLEQRDYELAYQKLWDKAKDNTALLSKLKGVRKISIDEIKKQDIALHRLILKEMALPPRFHSIRFKQHLKDVLASDCILLPSFSPLDIPFFRKTGDAPIGMMGMVNDLIFGDEYLMSPYEFAIHDVNHFFDAIYQTYISMVESGTSPLENLEIWEKTKDFFQEKIDSLDDQELKSAVELVIFEVLHEEGHTYDLDNMRRGLEESNIYLNDLLDFLKRKIGELNFFKPPGSKPILSEEAQQQLEKARQTLSGWIRERAAQLGDSPAGKLSRSEKEIAYTERRAHSKKITPDSPDYQFRMFSENMRIVQSR